MLAAHLSAHAESCLQLNQCSIIGFPEEKVAVHLQWAPLGLDGILSQDPDGVFEHQIYDQVLAG